jgi:hypothetical protein
VTTIQAKTGRGFSEASKLFGTEKISMKLVEHRRAPRAIQGNLLPSFFERIVGFAVM